MRGICSTAAITSPIAAQTKPVTPSTTTWGIEPRDAKHMDPFVHYGIAAAEQAIADAGLEVGGEAEGERVGVYIGSGLSGWAMSS